MTKELSTFYSYINNNKTENTCKFIRIIGSHVIEKLPETVCSSKIIYNLLRSDLDTELKQYIFKKTFMEYFKWKITS